MSNKPKPKISVITVTYNAEKVIERTLKSVASQTYAHIEYILIDGASKDNTLALTKPYLGQISTCISEPDKGIYDAMNKGISQATGDYLCFLNAGDTFYQNDTLEQMIATVQSDKLPDVIYGETALVNMQEEFIRMRRLSTPETLTWKSFSQGMLVCHQAFLARRALVEPYSLNYRYSADFDWCINIMKKADTLHNTHLTLINYLDEGVTTQNRRASLRERFHIMTKHYGLFSTLTNHAWFVIRLFVKPGQ